MKRLLLVPTILLIGCIFLTIGNINPATGLTTEATPETYGSISVAVDFSGEIPERKQIDFAGNQECPGDTGLDQNVVVNDNGTLRNAVVAVQSGPLDLEPAQRDQTVVVDLRECMYTPRVVTVRTGEEFILTASDPAMHASRGTKNGQVLFNQSFFQGSSYAHNFDEEGVHNLQCVVHPWMNGYIYVTEHGHAGVTDEKGKVSIDQLPPGDYTLKIWHEKFGSETVDVVLSPNEEKPIQITVDEQHEFRLNVDEENLVFPPDDAPVLHQASARGDVQKIEELLGEGVDVLEEDSVGKHPLYYASRNNQFEASRLLFIAGGKEFNRKYYLDFESSDLYQKAENSRQYDIQLREKVSEYLKLFLGSTDFPLAWQALEDFGQEDVVRVSTELPLYDVQFDSAVLFINFGHFEVVLTEHLPIVVYSIAGPNQFVHYPDPDLFWFENETTIRKIELGDMGGRWPMAWNIHIYESSPERFKILGWMGPVGSMSSSRLKLWSLDDGQVKLMSDVGFLGNVIDFDFESKAIRTHERRGELSRHSFLMSCQPLYTATDKLEEIDSNCTYGEVPLHLVASLGTPQQAKKVLEDIDPDFKAEDKKGRLPLHIATRQAQAGIVKLFIEYGADPNLTDKKGRASLHVLWDENYHRVSNHRIDKQKFPQTVDNLLEAGAEIDLQDNQGQAPLHKLVLREEADIVWYFLEKGADPTIADKDGKTPLDLAVEKEHEEIVELLESYLD